MSSGFKQELLLGIVVRSQETVISSQEKSSTNRLNLNEKAQMINNAQMPKCQRAWVTK